MTTENRPQFMVAVITLPVSGKAEAIEKYRQQVLGVVTTAYGAGYRLIHEYSVGSLITFIFERFNSDEELDAVVNELERRKSPWGARDRVIAAQQGVVLQGPGSVAEPGDPDYGIDYEHGVVVNEDGNPMLMDGTPL